MLLKRPVIVLGLSLAFFGCRVRDGADSGLANGNELPQLVGGKGDAAASTKVGTYGQGGGKHVVLDLTRPPSGTSPNLWRCWPTPPADYALGRAVCTTDKTKVVELLPANVEVACSNDPGVQTTAASTPLPADCAAYDVYSYQFDPPLTLKVLN